MLVQAEDDDAEEEESKGLESDGIDLPGEENSLHNDDGVEDDKSSGSDDQEIDSHDNKESRAPAKRMRLSEAEDE